MFTECLLRHFEFSRKHRYSPFPASPLVGLGGSWGEEGKRRRRREERLEWWIYSMAEWMLLMVASTKGIHPVRRSRRGGMATVEEYAPAPIRLFRNFRARKASLLTAPTFTSVLSSRGRSISDCACWWVSAPTEWIMLVNVGIGSNLPQDRKKHIDPCFPSSYKNPSSIKMDAYPKAC